MHSFLTKSITFYIVLISIASAKVYRPLDDLDQLYIRDTQGKTPAVVQKLSLKQYEDFVAMDVNSYEMHPNYNTDSKKPLYLSVAQANTTLKAAETNPIVGLHMYDKYDPTNKGIGFCFGRAMFVDLYLSLGGLNRGSIKKAFVVGSMTSGGTTTWGWHVTTIAQSLDSNKKEIWLAIDPIFGRVMELKQWYKETLKMSTDGMLRLYITEPGKFAQTPTRYDEQSITLKFYNKYFSDMMKWFDKNDVTADLKM